EQVINNILEDKLVPYLDKLDRRMQRQLKPDPTPLVSSRYNVFQNDEGKSNFQGSLSPAFASPVPLRREKDTTRSLVNDKRLVAEQRERYSQYSVVVEELPLEPGAARPFEDYEDEYDDTYDGNQVGANDADSDDELISRR
ncbi:ASCC2 protein, partial [Ptilonorhynchus violaceus]|nr:ASCC2 protein [Ptilonorhynchus violaceus]